MEPRSSRLRALRRAITWIAICVSCLATKEEAEPGQPGPAQVFRRAPNVLLIVGDDHAGGTLGIDGDPHQATSRLDALARDGVRFNRAYCNAPVCTASRQSFITGLLPHASGVTRLTSVLPNSALTLGDWFEREGYQTAAIGKMHFNRPGARHGFQVRVDLPEYEQFLKTRLGTIKDPRQAWRPFHEPTREWLNAEVRPRNLPHQLMDSNFFINKAQGFLQRQTKEKRPFFLVVSFYDPHAPFQFPNDWKQRFRPRDFSVPAVSESDLAELPKVFRDLNPADLKGIQAAYYTAITYMDFELGRLLDALDGAGLAEDTIVIYLGDNGYLRGEHGRVEKHCHWEPAIRVPLIVRWKGHLPAGRVIKAPVELVDLFPTIVDLTGGSCPDGLQGESLYGVLMGKAEQRVRHYVFSEYLDYEEAMVRDERYKLIVGTGYRHRLDGYETGKPLPGPYVKLFDLKADPSETKNLASSPEQAAVKERLMGYLDERLRSTRKPDDQVPANLGQIEAIHWCLRPRD